MRLPKPYDEATLPRAVRWAHIYEGVVATILLVGVSLYAFIVREAQWLSFSERLLRYITLFGIGVLATPFAIGAYLPRQRWAWRLHVAMVGLGLASGIFTPVCVYLMIKLFDDDTRRWFDSGYER
jgi:hypothetical protein